MSWWSKRKRQRVKKKNGAAAMKIRSGGLQAWILEQETRLVIERPEVLLDIFDGAVRLRQRVAVNLDAFEFLVFERVVLRLRADDSHLCASLFQGERLLPHATVKRNGKVFDNDTDFFIRAS